MPKMQQEVLNVTLSKGMGGKKIQVPQMWKPEEPAGFRQFLRQDIQKELDFNSLRWENSNN